MADLRTLHPQLVPWAQYLFDYGHSIDGRLVVTSAFRTYQDQARLYHNWIAGLSPLPASPPGHGSHERGVAWDMARPGVSPLSDPLLQYLGEVWESWGGVWGGRWAHRDPVHFQWGPS